MAHGLVSTGVQFPDASIQTTAATTTVISTTNVLAATAGASIGAVGTYAMVKRRTNVTTTTRYDPGTNVAASDLQYANVSSQSSTFVYPAGTWKIMGLYYVGIDTYSGTSYLYYNTHALLALRVS